MANTDDRRLTSDVPRRERVQPSPACGAQPPARLGDWAPVVTGQPRTHGDGTWARGGGPGGDAEKRHAGTSAGRTRRRRALGRTPGAGSRVRARPSPRACARRHANPHTLCSPAWPRELTGRGPGEQAPVPPHAGSRQRGRGDLRRRRHEGARNPAQEPAWSRWDGQTLPRPPPRPPRQRGAASTAAGAGPARARFPPALPP